MPPLTGAWSITAARGDLSNVCEATGWKTLGPLLFLEVIFHIAVFYFSRKYYAILVAAAILGDNQTLLASQTKRKTLLEVLGPQGRTAFGTRSHGLRFVHLSQPYTFT